LSPRQWDIVAKALNHCTLPLFLKLVYATVARWKSYSKPQEVVLFKSVQQSIHALFDRFVFFLKKEDLGVWGKVNPTNE
jgi:hypothetical protein